MTSTTPFEEPTVAAEANAAEREAREAAALATRLEQRVANGDDTITAVELEEQQRAASWAALRAKGARARSARATRKQAEEAARASIESAAQALGNDEALIDAWEAATLALARLQTLATDRSRALAEHVGQLEQHHDTLVGRPATFGNHGGQLGGATFGLKSGLGHRFSLSIPDRGVSAVDVSADRLVESAIAVAAGRPDATQDHPH